MKKLEFIDANDSKNFFKLGKIPFYYKPPTTTQFQNFIKQLSDDVEEDCDKQEKDEE